MNRIFVVFLLFIAFSSRSQTYWQQQVNTKINVQLDDNNHFLRGHEEITYTNHSPDTLRFLYIHLFANAYKNDRTPFEKQMALNHNKSFYYSKPWEKGYIDSLQFAVDGSDVDFYSAENTPDIARIDLHKPLLPGGTITITTPFREKIPNVFSRAGHTGQAYYISQWFPKPAVYDRKGWHPISYLDQGEFYSDYGSYDVAITLPKNYILLATGNCTDAAENNWMDAQAAKPAPADTLYKYNFPPSDAELKTVHWHEDNIHDFAWFADKRWILRKDTVHSPVTDAVITTWSAFLPAYQGPWSRSNDYLKETIRHYGSWVGDYPYKTIKAVQGDMKAGGGMEYPTITLIDKAATTELKTTVIHEGGHNWFYGMLGTNERDHAWMDEGINTFYEQKTSKDLQERQLFKKEEQKKGVSISISVKGLNEDLLYYTDAVSGTDQAIDQTSANFTRINYGIDVYYKTAMMLRWLEKYMGAADFELGMKDYYNAWHHKHPYPEDLEACLKKHTSKDIGWFFTGMLSTDKKIDFKVSSASVSGNATAVTVKNNSGVLCPALIDVISNDSIVSRIWTTPFTGETTINLQTDKWDHLRIDSVVPDAKSTNNDYRRSSICHNFGLSIRPVAGLNRTYNEKLFISPALGYNQYDGGMVGLLFHNLTIPGNRFRFALAPMYSFGTKSLVGAGSVGYMWYTSGVFKQILLQTDVKMFHDSETHENLDAPLYGSYTKIAPSIHFTLRQPDALSTVERTLTLKFYNITEQSPGYNPVAFSGGVTTTTPVKPELLKQTLNYELLKYQHKNDRTYNPFSYSGEAQAGADFAKISAEGNIRLDYNLKNKALFIRGFAGVFIPVNNNPAIYDRYAFNATYSGLDDYLYDGTYLGRSPSNNLTAQQIAIQDGGFKVPVFNNADQSSNWMTSINMSTDLPLGKLPVRLFFDAGLIPNSNPTVLSPKSTTMLYDGGLSVRLLYNMVTVYMPFIMSNDFQNYLSNTYGHKNVFARSISFTINLQNKNWLMLPENTVHSITNGL